MVIAHPWVGLGLGTFMFNFKHFVTGVYPLGAPYAHNCYLQIASETGLIGLVTFLLILITLFYRSILTLIKKPKNYYWYTLLGSLAALLGFSIQMGLDTIFYNLDLSALFWLILGLSAALLKNVEASAAL